MMTVYRHVRAEQCDQIAVIEVSQRALLDRSLIAELCDELITFVDEQKPLKLLVSFSGVTRICTETINLLIRVRRQLLLHGLELALCEINDDAREVFRILRLDGTLFRIFPSRSEAIAELDAPSSTTNMVRTKK